MKKHVAQEEVYAIHIKEIMAAIEDSLATISPTDIGMSIELYFCKETGGSSTSYNFQLNDEDIETIGENELFLFKKVPGPFENFPEENLLFDEKSLVLSYEEAKEQASKYKIKYLCCAGMNIDISFAKDYSAIDIIINFSENFEDAQYDWDKEEDE